MNEKEYLVGSSLLNLNNGIDADYFVFDESKDGFQLRTDKENHIDYFYASSTVLNRYFNFEEDYKTSINAVRVYSILYQYDIDIIKQDFPITFHVLNHREEYIEFLKYLATNNASIFNIVIKNRQTGLSYCHKNTYHIAYLTYIFKNNSLTLTAEQKQKIQTIHDRQMPLSYLDELKAEIMAL